MTNMFRKYYDDETKKYNTLVNEIRNEICKLTPYLKTDPEIKKMRDDLGCSSFVDYFFDYNRVILKSNLPEHIKDNWVWHCGPFQDDEYSWEFYYDGDIIKNNVDGDLYFYFDIRRNEVTRIISTLFNNDPLHKKLEIEFTEDRAELVNVYMTYIGKNDNEAEGESSIYDYPCILNEYKGINLYDLPDEEVERLTQLPTTKESQKSNPFRIQYEEKKEEYRLALIDLLEHISEDKIPIYSTQDPNIVKIRFSRDHDLEVSLFPKVDYNYSFLKTDLPGIFSEYGWSYDNNGVYHFPRGDREYFLYENNKSKIKEIYSILYDGINVVMNDDYALLHRLEHSKFGKNLDEYRGMNLYDLTEEEITLLKMKL